MANRKHTSNSRLRAPTEETGSDPALLVNELLIRLAAAEAEPAGPGPRHSGEWPSPLAMLDD